MQISVIFVKKGLKINMLKMKNIKIAIVVIMQVNIEVLHIVRVI